MSDEWEALPPPGNVRVGAVDGRVTLSFNLGGRHGGMAWTPKHARELADEMIAAADEADQHTVSAGHRDG